MVPGLSTEVQRILGKIISSAPAKGEPSELCLRGEGESAKLLQSGARLSSHE